MRRSEYTGPDWRDALFDAGAVSDVSLDDPRVANRAARARRASCGAQAHRHGRLFGRDFSRADAAQARRCHWIARAGMRRSALAVDARATTLIGNLAGAFTAD